MGLLMGKHFDEEEDVCKILFGGWFLFLCRML